MLPSLHTERKTMNTKTQTRVIELSGRHYIVDLEGLEAIVQALQSYKDGGQRDPSGVLAVIYLGQLTGHIHHIH